MPDLEGCAFEPEWGKVGCQYRVNPRIWMRDLKFLQLDVFKQNLVRFRYHHIWILWWCFMPLSLWRNLYGSLIHLDRPARLTYYLVCVWTRTCLLKTLPLFITQQKLINIDIDLTNNEKNYTLGVGGTHMYTVQFGFQKVVTSSGADVATLFLKTKLITATSWNNTVFTVHECLCSWICGDSQPLL